MKTINWWLALATAVVAFTAWAGTRYVGDSSPVTSRLVRNGNVKIVEIHGYNNTTNDLYIMVVPWASITNGQTAVVSEKAFAGVPFVIRFNQPLELDRASVAVSTDPNTVTNITGSAATDRVTLTVLIQD